MIPVSRKRNRRIPVLDSPFDADDSRMHPEATRDFYNHRILDRRGILRRTVPFGPSRGTDRAIGNRNDIVGPDELDQLRLLKMRVQLHLIDRGLNTSIAQEKF